MDNLKTRVVLETVDKTKKGVDSGISNLNRLGSTAKSLGRTLFAIAGTGGLGATAFTAIILNAAKANDEMIKAAQGVGTTTERLSELRYAGELAGVAAEGIDKAVARAAKSAEDFRNESKIAVDSFAKIGLDPTQFKDSADLFEAIIIKLSEMEDGTRKTAIAQELLGKSGRDLIPLINGGAEGLASAAKEARELGIVINTDTARASEKLLDDFTRMQTAIKGVSFDLAEELIPSLADTTGEIVKSIKEGERFKAVLLSIGAIGRIPIDFFFPVEKIKADSASIIKDLEAEIKTVESGIERLRRTGGGILNEVISGGNLEELEQKLLVLNNQLEGFKKFGEKLDENLPGNRKSTDKPETPTEPKDPVDPSNKKSELDKVREEILLLSQVNSIVSQGVALEDARTIAKLKQKGISDEMIVQLLNQQNLAKTLADEEKKAEDARQESIKLHADWLEKNAQKRLEINTMLYDMEQEAAAAREGLNESLDKEIEALQFEYSIRGLSTEEQKKQIALRAAALEFEEAMQELQQAGAYLTEEETAALKAKYDEIARIKGKLDETNNTSKEFGFTFKSGLEDAIVEGKELRDVLNGLEQDILRILTRRAVTEPLSEGIDRVFKKLPDIISSFFNFNANGNAFDESGIVPFANGGIVNQITPFTFANGGKFGVMGEAGPEAILPLTRGPNGKLGVQSMGSQTGANVTVNVYGAPTQPEIRQRDDGQGNISIDLMFEAVKSEFSKDIRSEGTFAQTLQGQYGLNRAVGAR